MFFWRAVSLLCTYNVLLACSFFAMSNGVRTFLNFQLTLKKLQFLYFIGTLTFRLLKRATISKNKKFFRKEELFFCRKITKVKKPLLYKAFLPCMCVGAFFRPHFFFGRKSVFFVFLPLVSVLKINFGG